MSMWIDQKYVGVISTYLEKFSRKGSYSYNFRCPICGDSQIKKNKARGYIFAQKGGLFYKCHNCQISLTLGSLIKHVAPNVYTEYCMERYSSGEAGRKPHKAHGYVHTPITFASSKKPTMLNDVLVPFADLSEDNEAYQYAIGRNIPKNRHKDLYYVDNVQKLKTLVDGYEEKIVTEEARLVLPFIDASGVLVGLTGRALRGETQRYMNMRVVPGASMVFGMNRVNVSETVYVTEGAIDSLCIHNCVAAGGSNLRTAADVIDKENLVLVFDNEPRAKEILSIMKKAIDDNFAVCVWPESYEEKDINKMLCDGKSQEEIENTIKERTFKGAAALLEYNRWSKF